MEKRRSWPKSRQKRPLFPFMWILPLWRQWYPTGQEFPWAKCVTDDLKIILFLGQEVEKA